MQPVSAVKSLKDIYKPLLHGSGRRELWKKILNPSAATYWPCDLRQVTLGLGK